MDSAKGKLGIDNLATRATVVFNSPRVLTSPDFYRKEVTPRYMNGDQSLGLKSCNSKWTKQALHTFGERPAKFYNEVQIQGAMQKLFEVEDPMGGGKC